VLEVVRFLAEHVPFGGLDADVLADIAASIEVEFFDRGASIIEQGGPVAEFVHLIRRGSVEVLDGERVVDVLTEGDLFGFPSLLSGTAPALGIRAAEETLCYLIDGEHARAVFSHPSGMRFLTISLRHRHRSNGPEPSVVTSTVGEVAAGPLVSVTGDTPVVEVARLGHRSRGHRRSGDRR
jgi:CBS domain-containing protein